MQCCLDTAVLVVSSVLFLHPASLVTAFGHHLMPSNGLAELVIRALSDITYYDHYEIRITMRREHSAALVHDCRAAAKANYCRAIQRTGAS